MLRSRRLFELVLPLTIFIVSLLLFPAAHGSFVSTHGPVTALRSVWAAALLFLAIAFLLLFGTLQSARYSYLRLLAVQSAAIAASDRLLICTLRC